MTDAFFEVEAAGCPHQDVQPIPGRPDWGRCAACGAEDFPLTDRAAYGDTSCGTCHDTGLVPTDVPGALADGPCPACPRGGQ